MDLFELNRIAHVIIGSFAFGGGIIALSTKKGSKIHKTGGWIFVFGMFYSAISTIIFMMEEFLPLAVLMGFATVYLLMSSIAALRHTRKSSYIIDRTILLIPILLFAFSFLQFVRILPEISLGAATRLLFALTFGILILKDIKLFRSKPEDHLFYVKRHAFRMILTFGFAVMAIIRIGIKIDFISLEMSTFAPLLVSLIVAFFVEKNIHKFLKATS